MKTKIQTLFIALLALALPTMVHAQFQYSDNGNGTCTITNYTGLGGAVTIPTNINNLTVTSIGDGAFFNNKSGLTGVTIPNTVTSIGIESFAYNQYLNNASIPNSVTSIGYGAFAHCDFGTITIPASVTSIGDYAFADQGTYSATAFFLGNAPPDDGTIFMDTFVSSFTVYYTYGTTGWGPTFGGAPTALFLSPFGYQINGGTVTIYSYLGTNTVVTVPSSINGLTVTSIGDYAFETGFYYGLASVILPNSVTSIGNSVFDNCSYLANVNIPNGVTNIGESAFEDCFDLTNVNIPNSVASIGSGAFGKSGLINVTIPASVTNLGDGVFSECFQLRNVIINNKFICDGEFEDDQNLTSVTIRNTVTNIGVEAFQNCSGLTNLIIPNSVISIGEDAMRFCTSLTNVTIPNSVITMGDYAFWDCSSLYSVYFAGNAPSDDGTIFSSDPATVYYLLGTTGWGSTFGSAPTELWNPQAVAAGVAGGHFGFNITGPTNATVVVEASASLSNPVWLPVSTNTFSASGTSSFSDPQSGNYPNRYYRFRSP